MAVFYTKDPRIDALVVAGAAARGHRRDAMARRVAADAVRHRRAGAVAGRVSLRRPADPGGTAGRPARARAKPVQPEQLKRIPIYGRALIESPSAERARLATLAVSATVPAGERLQRTVHPWSAYLVVPAFGLANAGVRLDSETLHAALHSRGHPRDHRGPGAGQHDRHRGGVHGWRCKSGIGILPGRVRYSHLLGGAILAGIGFTIALFITDLAFTRTRAARPGKDRHPRRIADRCDRGRSRAAVHG